MSDIKLFSIIPTVKELTSSKVLLEKDLQSLIEKNMETFFGVRFLKSEYITTNGRMDSIGIDENNCPVIFEYKRSSNENIINQGLFYLDWLLDHKADFHLLVADILGSNVANSIDWTMPCVYCIANSFTRYDEYAIKQIRRNIKLVQYHKYGNDLIIFEHLNTIANPNQHFSVSKIESEEIASTNKSESHRAWTCASYHSHIQDAPDNIRELFQSLCDYIESLGDDITQAPLKWYLAYKKVRNIFCMEVFDNYILLYLQLDPDAVNLEEGFSRDMRGINHRGTGDVRLSLRTPDDLEKAKPLLKQTYDLT